MSYTSRRQNGPIQTMLAVIQLIRKKPRTRIELAELLEVHPDRITNYLLAMNEEGLVSRTKPDWHGKTGGTADEWEWIDEQK